MLIKIRYAVAALMTACLLAAPAHATYEKNPYDYDDSEMDGLSLDDADKFWDRSTRLERRGHKGKGKYRKGKRERREMRRMRYRDFDFEALFKDYAEMDFDHDCLEWWAGWFGKKKLKDFDIQYPIPNDKKPPVSEVPTPGALILFSSALGLFAGARARNNRRASHTA